MDNVHKHKIQCNYCNETFDNWNEVTQHIITIVVEDDKSNCLILQGVVARFLIYINSNTRSRYMQLFKNN